MHLEIGESVSGLLADGVEDTPWVGATIRLDGRRGLVVEVPYLQGADGGQFDHVMRWFASQEAPPNMWLLTPEGSLSLFDIVWMGRRHSFVDRKASIGTLRPSVVVFGSREGSFGDPLVIDEMYSWIDGLNGWSAVS